MGSRFAVHGVVGVCLVTICLAVDTGAGAESAAGAQRNEKRQARPQAPRLQPTHADEKYGDHAKQAFDLYLVQSDKPTPLFIWIHGGGFRGGDKRPVNAQMVRQFHEHGVSFASLNYRLTDVGPYPMPMLDAARGLQTIRSRAQQYNIDPTRIACGGSSAGAGISMWLLYHDDLADPKSDDPVARQSTRITCALSIAGQTSYDPRTIQKLFGTEQVHEALVQLYGMKDDRDLRRPEVIKLFEDASAINHATRDDPPLYLYYPQANEPLPANSPGNRHIHHPKFGSFLKEKTDPLGLEVVLKLREDYPAGSPDVTRDQVNWVLKQFGSPVSARPNIVLFLADDLGYGDLGCYGGSAPTPHVDRLAQEGVRFTHFYSNGPECSPTRTALLTGRYQQRVGGLECAIGTGNVGRYDDAIRLCAQHDLGLPVSEISLARRLKDVGYATALIGKWHLGYEDKFSPNAHGFDHAFYCLGGGMDYFHHVEDPPTYLPVLRLDGAPIRRPGYITDLIADDAVRWLRQVGQRPFFLYVPFTAPHSPYQGPEDGAPAPLPADSSRWKQGSADPRVYAAMIERMDQAIGRILDTVNELGAAANTLVVFASDNGGTRSARQGGLRGYKGSTFEGGIRVPCIVRWPGVLPAHLTTEQAAVSMDLTASIVAAAGAAPPTDRPFDGLDILPRLMTRQPPVPRTLYWRARRGEQTWRAVRDGTLKYVSSQNNKTREEHLFDLDQDMGEKNDLLAARPEDAARLKRLLADWEGQVRPRR